MTSSLMRALTVLEVVGVIAVIAILAGLLFGLLSRGYVRAKKLNRDIEEGQTNIIEMQKPGGLLSAE